jgi:nitroreductase
MMLKPEVENTRRRPEYKINSLFVNRRSPRSMSREEELNDEDIMSLFEAAKWAPSSFNNQQDQIRKYILHKRRY